MKKFLCKTFCSGPLVAILLGFFCTNSLSSEAPSSVWEYNQIEQNQSGYFVTTGTDPYIVFPEDDTAGDCSENAARFSIRFKPMPSKPFLMELFWRPEYQGFSEARKFFFVLQPEKAGDKINFTIPLKRQAGYKQIRLDFPRDFKSSFIIEEVKLIPLQELPKDSVIIEPYYNLSVSDVRTPRVIIPHLMHTIKHGGARMTHDPIFLLTWLLLITMILFTIRVVTRDIQIQKTDSTN